MKNLDLISQPYIKAEMPELSPGFSVKVHQRIKEGEKERVQIFEGLIIAVKHGRGITGTITVRKIAEGVGVERIFPIHAPTIVKIEVIRKAKVRRAKLYFLRGLSSKKTKAKTKELVTSIKVAESPKN
ncbi:MAG: 50S ribosomal protein L19 [Candidatus Portnoybacteria bacterium CG10_big_fil_rev_8_21_14_0_10_36_7]|uniref:Large ribosomal subunit protein bL19 n=1 Tax=Candidatus Portnoybacteria bacterium CG10_big_fil_rev_8_21_14_0_10_36_7 TaxID=1974812 RepID=A0A2M8KDL5_9BACT|nr:MAG: 50S ribosomal protein L19 [Candidatus Portnoybacteria bacterium CG10_big_fil_rev_8_21_14_0_10_36_7]